MWAVIDWLSHVSSASWILGGVSFWKAGSSQDELYLLYSGLIWDWGLWWAFNLESTLEASVLMFSWVALSGLIESPLRLLTLVLTLQHTFKKTKDNRSLYRQYILEWWLWIPKMKNLIKGLAVQRSMDWPTAVAKANRQPPLAQGAP